MKTNIVSEYFALVKPGIVLGNALTAIAGFFLGARWGFDFQLFCYMLLGISLIVASGCVFNNYIDRDIDAVMVRTRTRPLVTGTISLHNALSFAILLAISGTAILYLTNPLATDVGLFGLFVYVVVYSMWSKRNTLHATVIGAVAGSVPPVVGYVAQSHALDLGSLILFLILLTWQMPHALAIAIRRYDDYKAAGIPVMPVALGIFPAKAQMLTYSIAFLIAAVTLRFAGYAGRTYLFCMICVSLIWIALCLRGFWERDEKAWAKKVFLFSLAIILVFCLLSVLNPILP